MKSINSDDDNRVLVTSSGDADRLNASFYSRFPYPWRPPRIDRTIDSDVERITLCQSVGDWRHELVPKRPSIWVAGCGTNQAILTALKFPNAKVIGSDVSKGSLDVCARTASDLLVDNLELREESLNLVTYNEEFDYIVCTGVIHHNADPAGVLSRLSKALRPLGILELMVYNRFHRTLTSAFQKAIRAFSAPDVDPGSPEEIAIAKELANTCPGDGLMGEFIRGFKEATIERFADALVQPIEYNYTVESLSQLAMSCNLRIAQPCFNIFDKASCNTTWNLAFASGRVRERYYRMDDLQRWYVTNLLLHERSPMLWFYMVHDNAEICRSSERELCQEFLASFASPIRTKRQGYLLDSDGTYRPVSRLTDYPVIHSDQTLARLVERVSPLVRLYELFKEHGLSTSFPEANESRLKLTTPICPYLRIE